MAQKYMSYNKVLLTFTVPNRVIKTHNGIKNARFSKMTTLLQIKTQLTSMLSKHSNIKYFCVIELGSKFSTPHLHCQVWIDGEDMSAIEKIKSKIIKANGLQHNRCHTSTQDTNKSNLDIFSYVIKTFSKSLSDEEIWTNETQKKRYRKHYGKAIRFYTKSKDSYSKSIYRKLWYSLGIARNKANDFLDFFINKFFFFNKRNLPKISSFAYVIRELGYILTRELCVRLFFVLYGMFLFIPVYVFAPALDPPVVLFVYICKKKKLKEFIMFYLCFIMRKFVLGYVFVFMVRIRGPSHR